MCMLTLKKKNNKNNATSHESVDDENDSDKEYNKKRKISALVMWYLPVIDHLNVCSPTLGMQNWYADILRSVGKIMRRFDTL
jgi:membrane protein YqaA with SNARE-associated domain